MRYRVHVLGVVLLMLTGCSRTFNVVKPVYPGIGSPPNFLTSVEDLQPTFKWEAAAEPGVSYDLVIYEIVVARTSWDVKRSVGEKVYYKEALLETEHRITEPLQPGKEYCWSIRTRRGSLVSDWSRYDQFVFFGTGYSQIKNAFFMFKTKKAEAGEGEAVNEIKDIKEAEEEDPWAPDSLRLTNPPITK